MNQSLIYSCKVKLLKELKICEATGETISEPRLLAIPWTRFSIQAMESLEKR